MVSIASPLSDTLEAHLLLRHILGFIDGATSKLRNKIYEADS